MTLAILLILCVILPLRFPFLAARVSAEAQQMARHADISTTMIYAHNIDRIKNAAEINISRLLD